MNQPTAGLRSALSVRMDGTYNNAVLVQHWQSLLESK